MPKIRDHEIHGRLLGSIMTVTANAQQAEPASSAIAAIERLANSDVQELPFFQNYLEQVVAATGGDAGAVWSINPQGLLAKLCEQDLDTLGFSDSTDAHRVNVQWVMDALKTGDAAIYTDEEARGQKVPKGIATLLAPILIEDSPVGLVQVFYQADRSHLGLDRFQRGEFGAAADVPQNDEEAKPARNYLEDLDVLQELCVYAARYLKWRGEASSPTRHLEFWGRFERTVASLHNTLNPVDVAATATNDGRGLLPCDRLSLAVKHGPKCVIASISGQDAVNRRSNLVRSMETLSDAVIATGMPITFNGSLERMAPQIAEPLAEYLSESGSRTIMVIPLKRPAPITKSDKRSEDDTPPFAALVVEQITESWITPLTSERADLLAEHVATSLHNAQSHSRLFLLPLWRCLGRGLSWFHGRNWLKFAAACFLLSSIVACLAFVPATYRVEGTGKLLPVIRQEVFAAVNGEVAEIFVRSGQRVEQGTPLLRLKDEELASKLLELRNTHAEKLKEERSLKVEIGDSFRQSTKDTELKLHSQLAQVQIEIAGLTARIKALEEQEAALTVQSTIAGTVSTFQLEQLLLHRPVVRGESLLEIMDESGPWQLEVEVPEFRMGHVWDAASVSNQPLPISFVLATAPESTFEGELDLIASRSGLSEEHGTAVDATVSLDDKQLPHRKIGAEAIAKIDCGQKNLAYVLFGDVYEFVQRRLW
ncbi:MAG: hypothetical protein CMJ78_21610 [Planctomycetaceae bacterium]|nr:hypothetical protein [Planctomycetaceae bacterium]